MDGLRRLAPAAIAGQAMARVGINDNDPPINDVNSVLLPPSGV
ncbi:hypothetical protein [uncultured Hoeflea sp.]|nr:hypothetical protein [uncultured Hoeflea sp.]